MLTFAFTFPSLGSRTSTHQLQQLGLQLGIVPPVIEAVIWVQVEQQTHLQGSDEGCQMKERENC